MTTENSPHAPKPGGRSPRVMLIAAAVAAMISGIYASKSMRGNGAASMSTQAPPAEAREAAHPAVSAAFAKKPSTEPLSAAAFQNAAGQPVSLESFRGRVVLLNLWATWCVPCRKEMPALDKLQAEMGSKDFEVVALAIDRAGAAGAKKFLDSTGVKNLALYADPSAKLASEFNAVGLPTTILIGRDGREIGRLLGPAEWAAEDAKALLKSALGGG